MVQVKGTVLCPTVYITEYYLYDRATGAGITVESSKNRRIIISRETLINYPYSQHFPILSSFYKNQEDFYLTYSLFSLGIYPF